MIDDTGSGPPTSDGAEFTITRVVETDRVTLWRLWTDPAELARWFHPSAMHTPTASVSVDLREGGRYRYDMVHDDTGDRMAMGGIYLEVVEPERLVFTWGEPADPDAAPVITVTMADAGDGRTELTLHVSGVAGRPGDDSVYDGWSEALDHLVGQAT
jgi:uncharacterized protein YndB with AHSA1/START domain